MTVFNNTAQLERISAVSTDYCGFQEAEELTAIPQQEHSAKENERKKNFLLVFDSHFATFFSLAATFNCTFLSFYIYLMNIYRLKIVLNKSEKIAITIRKNESAHFLVSVNKFCVYLWVKRIVNRTIIVFCQWDFGCNQHWKSWFQHFFPPFACISYY